MSDTNQNKFKYDYDYDYDYELIKKENEELKNKVSLLELTIIQLKEKIEMINNNSYLNSLYTYFRGY
jgi:hypothetical protein